MSSNSEPPKRRALGKGLESLLPRAAAAVLRPKEESAGAAPAPAQGAAREAASGEVAGAAAKGGVPLEIELNKIERNPFQTRTNFDNKLLLELGSSIAEHGVIQPIVVRPLKHGRFQLISGERRWLASKLVNKATVPAVVREVGDAEALEMTIIENLQRADLNPLEQARAFERLGREFKLTQDQVAQRTGKDRTTVANFVRLLRLPQDVQRGLERGELSMGHAKALLAIEDPNTLMFAANRVIEQALSVRQTEKYVQGLLAYGLASGGKKQRLKEPLDPNVREARDLLQRSLGLKVSIEDKKGHGKLTIEYGSVEDFDELMLRLMPEER